MNAVKNKEKYQGWDIFLSIMYNLSGQSRLAYFGIWKEMHFMVSLMLQFVCYGVSIMLLGHVRVTQCRQLELTIQEIMVVLLVCEGRTFPESSYTCTIMAKHGAEDLEQEQGGIKTQSACTGQRGPGPWVSSCHPLRCPEKDNPWELAGCNGLPWPCVGHPSSMSSSASGRTCDIFYLLPLELHDWKNSMSLIFHLMIKYFILHFKDLNVSSGEWEHYKP